jgi:hypothetical protein
VRLWGYLLHFFPALPPQSICLPKKTKDLWPVDFVSNIFSILELLLFPASEWGCSLLPRPAAPENTVTDGEHHRALLLVARVGSKPSLDSSTSVFHSWGPNLNLGQWQSVVESTLQPQMCSVSVVRGFFKPENYTQKSR